MYLAFATVLSLAAAAPAAALPVLPAVQPQVVSWTVSNFKHNAAGPTTFEFDVEGNAALFDATSALRFHCSKTQAGVGVKSSASCNAKQDTTSASAKAWVSDPGNKLVFELKWNSGIAGKHDSQASSADPIEKLGKTFTISSKSETLPGDPYLPDGHHPNAHPPYVGPVLAGGPHGPALSVLDGHN